MLPGFSKTQSTTQSICTALCTVVSFLIVLSCRRAFWSTAVVGAVLHQGGVTELQIQKPRQIRKGMRQAPGKAGQHCYLNILELSRYEWHPFSFTSGMLPCM